jgi:hypothetical protein
MTGACAIGALILGAIYVGTARYQEAARTVGERTAVTEMLGLDSTATVTEVRQFLDRERREVLYDVGGEAAGTRIIFTLDGQVSSRRRPRPGKKMTRSSTARASPARAAPHCKLRGGGGLPRHRTRSALGGAGRLVQRGRRRVVEHEEDPPGRVATGGSGSTWAVRRTPSPSA